MSLLSDELAVVFMRNREARREFSKIANEDRRRCEARRRIEELRDMKEIDELFDL